MNPTINPLPDQTIQLTIKKNQHTETIQPDIKQNSNGSSINGNGSAIKKNGHTPTLLNGETIINVPVYNSESPYKALLTKRQRLNGEGSEKETYHIELSIKGSGITYQPGDSLAVLPINSEHIVNELVAAAELDGNTYVKINDNELLLKDVLQRRFEISTLNKETLVRHNEFARSTELQELIDDQKKWIEYLYGNDFVDLLRKFPATYGAHEIITVLRPMVPRYYTIASSQKAFPDQVHLTIEAVRYHNNNRSKTGAASVYLAGFDGVNSVVSAYVKENKVFKMPAEPTTDIIMIGPGTGIAPFRAFMQERTSTKATGRNWLFFGSRHSATDFLYEHEWTEYFQVGMLDRFDVAFSRDTDEKVYVQNRIEEHAAEFFKWIESGAHVFICGDKNHMAKDVKNTIIKVIKEQGNLTQEHAEEYLKNLRKQKRYKEDVY